MSSNDTLLAVFEPLPEWLNFLAMAAAVILASIATLIWLVMFRKKRKRKKRKHHTREKRQLNPTLAQVGGLPPLRETEKLSGQNPPT